MTAVMRAMSVQTGPKVLRIGLVQGGRVIEERIIKQRTTVNVGSNERATFVIQSQLVPPMFKLFEIVGNDYYLNFLDGMTGRVALESGITDLNALKSHAKKVNNVYQVKLTEEARGKVVVGDTTFLFQFVAPPPVQPRPQLPLAVKGGIASQIDWSLTIIAAFSFLAHFGIVGAMYSDWMDQAVGDDSIAGLVDMMQNIPPPPVDRDRRSESDRQRDRDGHRDKPKPAGGSHPQAERQTASKSASAASATSRPPRSRRRPTRCRCRCSPRSARARPCRARSTGATSRRSTSPAPRRRAQASRAAPAISRSAAAAARSQGGGKGGGLAALGGGTKGTGDGTGAGGERKVEGPKADAQIGGTTASVPV